MRSQIEQIVSENTFSGKNIVEDFKRNISTIDGMEHVYGELIDKYLEYLNSTDEGNEFLLFSNISNESVIMELILLIMLSSHKEELTLQEITGKLSTKLNIEDTFDAVQVAADIVYSCEGALYSTKRVVRDNRTYIVINSYIELGDDDMSKLALCMYKPPMLCKPKKVTSNGSTGYLACNDSVFVGSRDKYHNKYVRLDAINVLNSIEFVLDDDIVDEFIEEQPGDKDKLEELRLGNEKELRQYGQIIKNWKQFNIEKGALLRIYTGRKFYFNHKLDSRGRMYCEGYHISYQSSEYNKAIISLSKYELITK